MRAGFKRTFGFILVGLPVGLGACFNSYVFDIIDSCEIAQETVSVAIQPTSAADILIVVDNSGSMCEEQQNLVDNFYNERSNNGVFECPLADPALRDDERFRNPADFIVRSELANCGFIQILAAYDNDFRVGVITTDVGMCDNRFNVANIANHPSNCDGQPKPDWGRRPQRGCLQAPTSFPTKFLTPETEDIGGKFKQILDEVQTFGSSFERGLDAMQVFLDPTAERHPDCADDAASFLREDASLLVIFLTDEDDCSHLVSNAFPDENSGESCMGVEIVPEVRNPPVSSTSCYSQAQDLVPVQEYVDFVLGYKNAVGNVRLAVIAGGLFNANGQTVPGSCTIQGGVPDGNCTPSQGSSNFTQPGTGATCDPERLALTGSPACCQADAGNRYYQLAQGIDPNSAFTDSICFASFRDTMRELAQFAARVEFVNLAEPPPFPAALQVEILRDGDAEPTRIDRISDGANLENANGWRLEENIRVQFYGSAIPQPGDDIRIFVLRSGDTDNPEGEQCVGFSAPESPDAG